MKRFLSLFLAFAMCFSLTAPAFAAATVEEPKMVDIELILTDDYGVVVSVPEDEAEAYQMRLDTEPGFREEEVRQALMCTSFSVTRELPPGIIDYQSYMYKDDIKRMVDSKSGVGTFLKWLEAAGWVVSVVDITKLIELTKTQSAIELAVSILGSTISSALQKQEQWWLESYVLIINGDISAVRYTVVQNNAEYPKAWLIYERI